MWRNIWPLSQRNASSMMTGSVPFKPLKNGTRLRQFQVLSCYFLLCAGDSMVSDGVVLCLFKIGLGSPHLSVFVSFFFFNLSQSATCFCKQFSFNTSILC